MSGVEQRLRDALAEPLDGEDRAEARAWEVVRAAAAPTGRGRALPHPRRPLRAVVALGLAALLVAFAATPPGTAVSDWIREGIAPREGAHVPADPALRALPGGGKLLVRAGGSVWIVGSDGARRRLGPYSGASWSPGGLYVAAVRAGRQLVAVTPRGDVRWALSPPGGVRQPRWSPTGLRIAYRARDTVRVVSGAGAGDAVLIGDVVAPPAWRPTDSDELAVADGRGRVTAISAVTAKRLWRSRPGPRPFLLAWSHDGERLAAVSEREIRIFDADGRLVGRRPPGAGARFAAAAYSPSARRLATLEHRHGGTRVSVVGERRERRLLATAARLEDLAWSPGGRWLSTTSPAADQWLFLHGGPAGEVRAKSRVAGQLDPGGRGAAAARISGWCCPR